MPQNTIINNIKIHCITRSINYFSSYLQMLTTSHIIVAKCVEYYLQLLDIEVHVDDNVKHALNVFGE